MDKNDNGSGRVCVWTGAEDSNYGNPANWATPEIDRILSRFPSENALPPYGDLPSLD